MKPLKHTFSLGFLNYNIEVIFTDDIKSAVITHCKTTRTVPDNIDGLHTYGSHVSYIFLLPDSPIQVIAHEAFHAVARACRLFSIPLKSSSEETYAYMLDFIIGEILKFKEKEKI